MRTVEGRDDEAEVKATRGRELLVLSVGEGELVTTRDRGEARTLREMNERRG